MSIRLTPVASNARTQEHLAHKDTILATKSPTTGAQECVSCFPNCSWTLPRFSHLRDESDTFKNDTDDFIISVPSGATVVGTLIQMHPDGTTTENIITDDTLGLFYSTGTVKADVWGFQLKWFKVADIEGFGKYKFNITITNSAATEIFNEDSTCYQLQNWTCQAAHRTFKIQTQQSGYFEGGFDYTGLDYLLLLDNGKALQATTWPQEVRLWGVFYRDGFPQERDNIVTEERGAQLVQSKIWKRYKLKVDTIETKVSNRLILDMLQAPDVRITDQNTNNIEVYEAVRVDLVEVADPINFRLNKNEFLDFTFEDWQKDNVHRFR